MSELVFVRGYIEPTLRPFVVGAERDLHVGDIVSLASGSRPMTVMATAGEFAKVVRENAEGSIEILYLPLGVLRLSNPPP